MSMKENNIKIIRIGKYDIPIDYSLGDYMSEIMFNNELNRREMEDKMKKNISDIVPSTEADRQPESKSEMLNVMFDWQRKFGDHCFEKNGIVDNEGKILSFNKIFQEYQEKKFGPNNLPNVWMKKFHECMLKELEEINELLPWKHWSKEAIGEKHYPDLDPQKRIEMLKIELVDVFHFFMSACMCLGMGPKELYDLYIDKNKVNFERQANEYNTANKTEEDNLALAEKHS